MCRWRLCGCNCCDSHSPSASLPPLPLALHSTCRLTLNKCAADEHTELRLGEQMRAVDNTVAAPKPQTSQSEESLNTCPQSLMLMNINMKLFKLLQLFLKSVSRSETLTGGVDGVPFRNDNLDISFTQHQRRGLIHRRGLPGASLPTLVNPSLMLEVSTAACLVKEEAPERSEWFRGSEKRQDMFKSPDIHSM